MQHVSHRASDRIAELESALSHQESLNKDAHAIIDRIWDIFGRPTYEQLAGRSIYDMVQGLKDREEEAAASISMLRDALSDAAYIACLQKDDNSERAWFIVGWQGGRHSVPNNEEQAWLYRRGMVARMAADPRDETEADRWCKHFTDKQPRSGQ